MNDVAAVVLAAGTASRFRAAAGAAGPATKLVASFDGMPLVRRVVEAALASGARPVVVVTGFAQRDVTSALEGLPVCFAHNPDFETGLASSLRAGIAALPGGVRGVVVLLGDMPLITSGLIDCLIAAHRQTPDALAIVPVFDGKRGNPVLIARALFGRVAALSGDTGARMLLQAAGDRVAEVVFDDAAVAFDVDTPDALDDRAG
jgi:molybdenum cofactor cytidylyltransferase